MSKPRTHLSVEERVAMKVLLHHRCSSRPSACKLCRSAPSSLRELAHNGGTVAETLAAPSLGRPGKACGYRCAKAHQRALRLARATPRGKQDGSMQPTLALGDRCTAPGSLAQAGKRHTPAHARRCAHQPRDGLHRTLRHTQRRAALPDSEAAGACDFRS
jgi:hypothetical protein